MSSAPPRPRLFAPLPTRGIWTSLDLTRGQFLAILLVSLLLFTFVDGPLWSHAHASHFWRLTLSYLFIPPAVALALWRNGKARLLPTLVGHASNTYAVRFFPPILVSFTTLLEPVLSSLAALAVLGELPPAEEFPAYALFAAATLLFLAARWVRSRRSRAR